jgi:hypothetical protein
MILQLVSVLAGSGQISSILCFCLVRVGWGCGGFLCVLSISIHQLLAHLLGKGQLNGLASWRNQLGHTLVHALAVVLHSRDGDALLLGQVLAADYGKVDGLVDAGLDGLGVGNLHLRLDNSDHGDIDAGLLGNLLAVVLSISSMTISILCWLAHSHHLGLALLVEGHLNGLGCGDLRLGLVGVGAHLVVNHLSALRADSPGDGVALLSVYHPLDSQVNRAAGSFKSRGAHLRQLNDIQHRAVMLGVLVPIAGLGVAIGTGRDGGGEGKEDEERKKLHCVVD